MSNLATYLQPGDMVDLDNDPVFDAECPGLGCPFRTQNAEFVEAEAVDAYNMRMVFRTNECKFVAVVPLMHEFADPG